jgi:hypothetical protein
MTIFSFTILAVSDGPSSRLKQLLLLGYGDSSQAAFPPWHCSVLALLVCLEGFASCPRGASNRVLGKIHDGEQAESFGGEVDGELEDVQSKIAWTAISNGYV